MNGFVHVALESLPEPLWSSESGALASLSRALTWSVLTAGVGGVFVALLLAGALPLLRSARARHAASLAALGALASLFLFAFVRELLPARLAAAELEGLLRALSPAGGELAAARGAGHALLGALDGAAERVLAASGVVGALWALGSALMALRVAAGWHVSRQLLRRHSVPAEPVWQARLARLGRRIGLRSRARLYLSDRVDCPVVPLSTERAVVVPFHALRDLPPEQLDALLGHELAHVRRQDGWVHLAQAAVESLLFFHPVAWWAGRRARAEREHCCDDEALAVCRGPALLARSLAALEASRQRGADAAPLGFARLASAASGGCLLTRIERLMPRRGAPTTRTRTRLLAAGACAAGFAGLAFGGLPDRAPRDAAWSIATLLELEDDVFVRASDEGLFALLPSGLGGGRQAGSPAGGRNVMIFETRVRSQDGSEVHRVLEGNAEVELVAASADEPAFTGRRIVLRSSADASAREPLGAALRIVSEELQQRVAKRARVDGSGPARAKLTLTVHEEDER